jgi:KaiC/GvpD/RAD55 family RecA-like ATPase/tetratricopeptide (TPR) repeat protein
LWAALQKDQKLEPLLGKAKELEKKYEWLDAADFYEKVIVLALEIEDFLGIAEFRERIGFCFYRAALQAETHEDFTSRLKLALDAYNEAIQVFEKVEGDEKRSKINHSKALCAFTSYWLETYPPKRKELLDEWWKHENEALKYYDEIGDKLAVGRICANLVENFARRADLASEWLELEKRIEEGLSCGERAIVELSKVGNDFELARAYCWTSFCYAVAVWFRVMEDRKEEFGQKSLDYSSKALELSQKIGDAFLVGHSNMSAGLAAWGYTVNPSSALKFFEDARKYGAIAKDGFLIGCASMWTAYNTNHVINLEENPDKRTEGFKKAVKIAQEAMHHLIHIISDYSQGCFAYDAYIHSVIWLSLTETNLNSRQILLKKAVEVGQELLKYTERWPSIPSGMTIDAISRTLYRLSETEMKISEKHLLLQEASKYREKAITMAQQVAPLAYWNRAGTLYSQALIQAELAKIETGSQKKRKLLEKAVASMENCMELVAKDLKDRPPGWKIYFIGSFYYFFGGILEQLYLLTKDKRIVDRAIEVYKSAIQTYCKAELKTREAESCWQMAKLQDLLGDNLEAAHTYESAAETYKLAGEKIPQLKEFYKDYSLYMQAWSQIEEAKYNHAREDYNQSRIHYEKAAKLHKLSKPWIYLAPNYHAWSQMEKAEDLSRKEESQEALQTFQQALELFLEAEHSIETRFEDINEVDEREMATKLIKASDNRRRYCRARISIEEAKILDRKGEYSLSSKKYAEAAERIEEIIKQLESEVERKEFHLMGILCHAWEKMAIAEEITSTELYFEAAKLFEKVKGLSVTRKMSLWALGNSSFCKGLAAGTRYQDSLDLKENAIAKRYIKKAASSYLQAGFRNASEYAKATQRMFDAYVFMNQAESEVDPERKAKQYQMAENLLQISAGAFMKAKQPEKTAQVQQILKMVREEKALAVSLNEVLHAPSITSSTLSFTAPTTTNEASVGLESFHHANVQANLVAHIKDVKVGESFCLSVEFVNAGREPALLMRVEGFVPSDFVVVKKPEIYRLEENCLNMKGKQLAPLKLVEAKLVLQPSHKGVYQLKPKVHYLDELGQNRSLQLKTVEIRVQEVILSARVSTGTKELDSLLLGGIPEGYNVVLTGSPSDERAILIKNFLESGTNNEENVFYISTKADGLENLLETSNFYLFLCNPKPKVELPDLPNIYQLRSKTDLTNLSISLAKAYRKIEPSNKKRICVELVSDILLDYGPRETRKWISELTTDLGSKGFTMLAVMNPSMHPSDQATAVIDIFDGEISITQTKDPLECKKSIRVEKLRNQDYIKNPICLTT